MVFGNGMEGVFLPSTLNVTLFVCSKFHQPLAKGAEAPARLRPSWASP